MSKKRMQISATLLGILLSAGTFASAYPVFAAQSEVSVEKKTAGEERQNGPRKNRKTH